eukprot:3296260-Rhodomonas_salina.1
MLFVTADALGVMLYWNGHTAGYTQPPPTQAPARPPSPTLSAPPWRALAGRAARRGCCVGAVWARNSSMSARAWV